MNDKNEAMPWVWGNEVANPLGQVYAVPTCPVCDEPAYVGLTEDNRCPFCGQLLKTPEEVNQHET